MFVWRLLSANYLPCLFDSSASAAQTFRPQLSLKSSENGLQREVNKLVNCRSRNDGCLSPMAQLKVVDNNTHCASHYGLRMKRYITTDSGTPRKQREVDECLSRASLRIIPFHEHLVSAFQSVRIIICHQSV